MGRREHTWSSRSTVSAMGAPSASGSSPGERAPRVRGTFTRCNSRRRRVNMGRRPSNTTQGNPDSPSSDPQHCWRLRGPPCERMWLSGPKQLGLAVTQLSWEGSTAGQQRDTSGHLLEIGPRDEFAIRRWRVAWCETETIAAGPRASSALSIVIHVVVL